MAVLKAVIFLLTASTCVCSSSLDFSEWCKKFDKKYSQEEREHREEVFKNNVQLVDHLNLLHRDREVLFSLNNFADLSPEEFRSSILMTPRPPPSHPTMRYVSDSGLPDSFDWREKGVVTNVKDQGSVGSCWAFSTVGNVEGQWAMSSGNLTSLSAEQLVDCDSTQSPNNNDADCGVFGGWPYLAYQYLEKAGGIESEDNYPYCSGSGQCFPCQAQGYNKTRCGPPVPSCNTSESCPAKLKPSLFVPGLKLKGWVAIEKNETVIQHELVSRGPLSIAINAETLQFYHSGVWDPLLPCDPTSLDHAVLLVGYGMSKGLFEKKPYWLIKNSWGEKWGESGYFRMIRGKGECGIDQQVTSALLH